MKKVLEIRLPEEETLRVTGGETLSEVLPLLADEKEIFIVYDAAVEGFLGRIGSEKVKGYVAVETSEEGKTMETVLMLCRSMMEAGLSREALVLALGGGILTDIAGFAASIYKRGVRYANIPTTLLAQVDAGLGGKTGVNFDQYKNMLGVIRQPQFTFLCPEVLQTLPERIFRAGAAELLKTFLLADAQRYRAAVTCLGAADKPDLGGLIFEAARIKAEIVARDPFEKGERRKLNLGHTFAHAIEHEAAVRDDDISHGEAVAMGLVLAARLSDRLGVSETPLADLLEADFAACGLRTDCPYATEVLAAAMARDKKAAPDGSVRLVLLRRIGETVEQAYSFEK